MPAIIAALGAVLINLLRLWAVSIIGRVLVGLGLGIYAYSVAVPDLVAWISSQFSFLPEFVTASAGACGIDIYMTMILSAYGVKLAQRVILGRWGTA